MLLARLGHDVVVVDQASFPSDTVSTHAIARSGVVQLRRWGLLDRGPGQRCPGHQAGHLPRRRRVGDPHDQAQGRGRPGRGAPAVRAGHDHRGRRGAGRRRRAHGCHRDRRAARRPRPGHGDLRSRPRRRCGRSRRPVRHRRRRPVVAGRPLGRRRDHPGPPRGRRGPVRLLRRHSVGWHGALRGRAVVRRGVPDPPRAGMHLGLHSLRRRQGGPPPGLVARGGLRRAARAFRPAAGRAAAPRPPDLAGAGHAAPAQPGAPGIRPGLGAGRRCRLSP